MSEESTHLLQVIRDELQGQGADIVGRVELTGDTLAAYDGQILLQAEVRSDPGYHPSIVHCHVIARIGRTSFSDPLDACVMGIDDDRRQGLAKAGQNWVGCVGSTLFSLLHARAVMNANHFDGADPWGVPGCHGFVGPFFGYGIKDPTVFTPIMNAGLFDCAAAMAPPGIIHLAKAVLEAKGPKGWKRTLEIDGHLACFEEDPWHCGIPAPLAVIASQFAVFHFGDQQDAVELRRRLDDAIRQFVSAVATTKDVDAASQLLRARELDPGVVHRVATFLPLAFFRVMFADIGVTFSPDYQRIKKDGTGEVLKLMREPAYARAIALCPDLMAGGLTDAVKMLATCSATFNTVNSALNSGSKPENLVISPAIIPDPAAAAAAVERGVKQIRPVPEPCAPAQPRKSWWRFW